MPFSNGMWFVKLPDGSFGVVYDDLFDLVYERPADEPRETLVSRIGRRIGKFA